MRSIGPCAFIASYSVAALILLYLGRSFASFAWLTGGSAVGILCMRAARYPFRAGVPLVLAGIGIAAIRITLMSADLPTAFVPLLEKKVALNGTVVAIPDVREMNEKMTAEITRASERTRVLATVPLYPPMQAGDRVRISRVLKRPAPFDTDGGRTFAYDQFLRKDGIFAVMTAAHASFVLMSGASSSTVRAGLMAGFATAARAFGRSYDALRVLSITFFLIAVWNPLMLAYDPGFQFSFIAAFGLIIGTPLISPSLLFLRSRVLIEMVATTLAAEISLFPLLLYETGNLSFVSLVANVAAMPAIPFAMAASALAAALALPLQHLSPVLPIIIGFPAYVPLTYVIQVATLSASLPFARRTLPVFPFSLVIVSYSILSVLVIALARVRARPPRPGNGSPPRSSSGSRRTRQYMSSSPMACNPPYTHAPTGR